MKPAVFLDRDGTVIEEVNYLCDPSQVRLLGGAAESLRALRAAGYACVLITNQSAIGRGLLTVETLDRIHDELLRHLALNGATLDGIYYCPVVPTIESRTAVEHPQRKPGPGMLLRAASDLGLDVSRSWMVGDMLSDVHAGRNAGCRGTILVRTGHGDSVDDRDLAIDFIAADVAAATRIILRSDRPFALAGRPTNDKEIER
jgi:D-glycero-D-manno-heptose 1,7-bisphosphate phosphatase